MINTSYATGTVQWLSADPATTVYTISGLPFEPRALRFYWLGLGSASDLSSNTTHMRAGHGFAVSPSSRRCLAIQDQDNVADTVCTSGMYTDCVAATVTATGPARDGALDLASITADGFTLVVNDAAPVNLSLFWEAWGGPGIDEATVGDITEPADIGEQDYSAPGFDTRGLNDQVVFIAGGQATAADSTVRRDAGLAIGWATSPLPSQQIVQANNSEDNVTTADCQFYDVANECLAMINLGSDGLGARAQLSAFLPDGFRLNWLLRTVTDRRYIYLAIKGGRWWAGSDSIIANPIGNTKTVTGIPFQPELLDAVGIGGPASTPGFASGNTANTYIIGTATSPSARKGQCALVVDSATAMVALALEYDRWLPFVETGAGVDQVRDLDAITSDGFRVIYVGPFTTEVINYWFGYLAFASPKVFLLH